eukprot:1457-Heterococcus_DN1.PRE.2
MAMAARSNGASLNLNVAAKESFPRAGNKQKRHAGTLAISCAQLCISNESHTSTTALSLASAAAGVASRLQMNLPNGRTMHVAKAAVQPPQQAKLHRTGVHVIEQVNFCGLAHPHTRTLRRARRSPSMCSSSMSLWSLDSAERDVEFSVYIEQS